MMSGNSEQVDLSVRGSIMVPFSSRYVYQQ